MYRGRKWYSGEYKLGRRAGNGTQYFIQSGRVKYRGEFDLDSGGLFQGRGILYDEDGDVVHAGEFVRGSPLGVADDSAADFRDLMAQVKKKSVRSEGAR